MVGEGEETKTERISMHVHGTLKFEPAQCMRDSGGRRSSNSLI